jgi:hypothetical protein
VVAQTVLTVVEQATMAKVPAGHVLHGRQAPALRYLPDAQVVQAEELLQVAQPAAHAEQTVSAVAEQAALS